MIYTKEVARAITRAFEVIIYFFWLLFLSTMLYVTVTAIPEDYNLFKAEKTTATVVDKLSKKSLFRTPTYYVKVDLNQNEVGEDGGIENRVTKWQMNQAEETSQVKGYQINYYFFTLYDLVVDSFVIIVASIVLILGIIALLVVPFLDRREKQQPNQWKPKKQRRLKLKREQKQKTNKISGLIVFLIIFFTVGCLFSSLFVVNTFNKLVPIGQTKTAALVVDKDSQLEILYFMKMFKDYAGDPTYSLRLLYETDEGEVVEVVKEVTRDTYIETEVGDWLEISYRHANPYDIFVSSSVFDVFELWVYTELFLYIIILFITFGYLTYEAMKYRRKFKSLFERLKNKDA